MGVAVPAIALDQARHPASQDSGLPSLRRGGSLHIVSRQRISLWGCCVRWAA